MCTTSAMSTPLATNQIEISVLHHAPFTNGDVAFHQQHGQPLMAWSPLAGGALFAEGAKNVFDALSKVAGENGVDESAVAVAWLMAHPSRIIPVLGTNNLDRISRIGDAAKVTMDRQSWYEIYTAALGDEVP